MRKSVVYIWIIAMIVSLCAGCAGKKSDETVPEFILTYADNQSENYPTTLAAYKFAELVEERTEGKVIINIKHSGELGTQDDVIDQLQFGGIDLARVSLSSISDELPRMNVFQLPFLYETEQQMWDVLESSVGQTFLNSLEQIDLVGLSWYEAGTRSFYSVEEPVSCVEDLQGKNIRVQDSEMMRDYVRLLGGNPVSVPYTDVYEAFETKKIDVAENNWSSYCAEKHYEVAKYYTINEHTRVPEIQMMSRKTWDKLPIVYRYAILDCAKQSAKYEKELWDAYAEEAKAEAIAKGCIVTEWSEEEIQKCKEMVMPLYEKYCSVYMYLIENIQKNEF